MGAIDLDTAKKHLEMWLEAEEALATSQSYTIGTMSLTRANLAEVSKRIEYWQNKVNQLSKNGRRNRVYGVIPMD